MFKLCSRILKNRQKWGKKRGRALWSSVAAAQAPFRSPNTTNVTELLVPYWKETNRGIPGVRWYKDLSRVWTWVKIWRRWAAASAQAALLWTQTTKWHCSCQWDSVHCCCCQWHTIVWPPPTTSAVTVQWPSSYCPLPIVHYLLLSTSTAQWPSSYSGTGSPEERVTSLGRMSCLA